MRSLVNQSIFVLFNLIVGVLPASACSVCFWGDPGSKANHALRVTVLAMIGVVVFILSLIINFLIGMNKRSKLI